MLVTMDGKQSLKLVNELFRAGTALHDERTGWSSLWLSNKEVDVCKDEVRCSVHIFVKITLWICPQMCVLGHW